MHLLVLDVQSSTSRLASWNTELLGWESKYFDDVVRGNGLLHFCLVLARQSLKGELNSVEDRFPIVCGTDNIFSTVFSTVFNRFQHRFQPGKKMLQSL